MMDDVRRARLGRLRWHCRRALLELDIVFQRFWERQDAGQVEGQYAGLDEETEAALERLLELQDHDLWELVSGRTTTNDPQLEGLIENLRLQ
jgi:succinate dehydrogenase flavin-adding protein (antitoxin of CptAB toxin-antitoxin module)